jgi:triosephosphate isomerase (TIM)
MNEIFVNLKRFEVSKRLGGLCPQEDPLAWVESVITGAAERGLGALLDTHLTFMLPEGLVAAAVHARAAQPVDRVAHLAVGCQGVHWEDIAPGKNFGAFTASQPATAIRHLGATWAIIGHSEERRAHQQVMAVFEPGAAQDETLRQKAARAADRLVNAEVLAGLKAGLNVLMCVGETAGERGEGSFAEQQPRIEQVLTAQVAAGLNGVAAALGDRQCVIGYEPLWAIGPGKVPPGKDYIAFVSALIQKVARETHSLDVTVVYGGGLKEENAAMIASIPTIGGGLVGLTRFTGEIGFDVDGLAAIVARYREALGAS